MSKGVQRIRPDTVIVGSDGKLTREGFNILSELFDQVQNLEGLDSFTAAQIAAAGNVVNVDDKQLGRRVYDSTNNRIMVASGSAPTSAWYVVDGSASVTPA